MSDKEALRAESILHDRVAMYRRKLKIVRAVCRAALDDCDEMEKREAGLVAIETLEHIRDHLAKEPDDG